MKNPQRSDVAGALTDAFLAGHWEQESLLSAGRDVFGEQPPWLVHIVERLHGTYRDRPADRRRELRMLVSRWLDEWFEQLAEDEEELPDWPSIVHRPGAELAMGRRRWPVPEIASLAELAAFLDLHLGELLWLADPKGLERSVSDEKLQNYRYRWIERRGAPPRLIESPKRRLKDAQRRVLHQVLDLIPPDDRAHGFRRGHSAATNARRHVGRDVVLGFDLESFFASVGAGRVYGIFRTAGYPETVAHTLTALCTSVVPAVEWLRISPVVPPQLIQAHQRLGARLATPHLPQGAPTSPALANLCALGLDRRIAGLASNVGATYSRYADDLTLSGGPWLLAHAEDLRRHVGAIARDEGFRVNERKSRLITQAGRQIVTGIVVNRRPNVARRDYERLRAILHDAAVHGSDRANRSGVADFRAHLLGRIAWVESLNPNRGRKLRRLFRQIAWPAHTPP